MEEAAAMKHLIGFAAEIPADKREEMSAPVQPRQCALVKSVVSVFSNK